MSYTQSSAEILRDQLSDNWSLLDPLQKAPGPNIVGDGTQYVYFFDRAQIVKNEKAKALVVEKIVHEGDENRIVHPKFIEQADIYEITLYLRVTSVNPDQFDVWLLNMDNMASETLRILKTIYDPTTTTGVFFQTKGVWENQDIYPSGTQPELRRKLRFTLTRIVSTDDEVFLGYGGVLVFDTSASTGDTLPTSDYTFTQVKNAKLREGYVQIPTLTKDTTNGVGVPFLDRGLFSGTFFAIMYAKKSDIIGTTTEKLQNIYKTQTILSSTLIGQQADVVFLQSATNTETTNSVNLIAVNNGGSGYTSAPAVTISGGGGIGAAATASISDESVVVITITSAGTGFTSTPTVNIAPPPSGTTATATASIAVVLTKQSFMKIIEIEEIDDVEDLVSYRISGQLTRPTVFTESA